MKSAYTSILGVYPDPEKTFSDLLKEWKKKLRGHFDAFDKVDCLLRKCERTRVPESNKLCALDGLEPSFKVHHYDLSVFRKLLDAGCTVEKTFRKWVNTDSIMWFETAHHIFPIWFHITLRMRSFS